jgi:hypothetical protein
MAKAHVVAHTSVEALELCATCARLADDVAREEARQAHVAAKAMLQQQHWVATKPKLDEVARQKLDAVAVEVLLQRTSVDPSYLDPKAPKPFDDASGSTFEEDVATLDAHDPEMATMLVQVPGFEKQNL